MAADPLDSKLADLRDLSLADMADVDPGILGEATRRALPETPAVPVAAFNSAV